MVDHRDVQVSLSHYISHVVGTKRSKLSYAAMITVPKKIIQLQTRKLGLYAHNF